MASPRRSAAIVLLVGALLTSCSSGTPRYASRNFWLQKDVIVVSVYLDRQLNVDDYLSIVDREMTKLRKDSLESKVPIYEVRFEFFLPEKSSPLQKRVARIYVHPQRTTSRLTANASEVILY